MTKQDKARLKQALNANGGMERGAVNMIVLRALKIIIKWILEKDEKNDLTIHFNSAEDLAAYQRLADE